MTAVGSGLMPVQAPDTSPSSARSTAAAMTGCRKDYSNVSLKGYFNGPDAPSGAITNIEIEGKKFPFQLSSMEEKLIEGGGVTDLYSKYKNAC